jgi:hypothetical protein
MLRFVKIILMGAVAAWGLVGVVHNLLSWEGTLASVMSATSMSTFEAGAEAWLAAALRYSCCLAALL